MRMKKLLSLLLALVMVLSLVPTTVFATEGEEDVVYLSVSFDSNYIDDKNGDPIVYVPIPLDKIEAIDLTEYGLDNMLYDADGDDDYETTALQLLIYAHEELYGGDWGDVNFDALPGSSYFRDGIFGFTENLVYFQNGDFPLKPIQSGGAVTEGATSDQIVLKAGDFLDVASFSCYNFLWDQAGGFHLFADEEDNYTHDYTTNAGEALSVKLKHSFCDLMYGQSWVKDAADYEVYYGSAFGEADGSVTTDESGNAEITFPNAGTYYVWCDGAIGIDDGYTHTTCDHYTETGEPCIVSSPAFAKVTVAGAAAPEAPRQPQDISAVLNATLAMQATTVAQPSFGTNYGEWTVFGLARGNYFAKDSRYFADYYNRIVEYVNTTAAKVAMSGALDKNKSTDNSRLIMALAAIGKDATSVGNWDLVEAYSANGMNWIRKQGMNGTICTLIALDCGNYKTSDPTIRQQCVDAILTAQHNDGGWSLVTAKTQPSNVDITGMTLTALYPYRDQPAVAAACEAALNWLSQSQLDNGGFPYGRGETSESCVWAIVAATTWGINPDTDPRFIKNGNSAIDNLLTYYLEDEAMFEHGRGAGANAMATDQATYGLVAYDRFINGKTALYDYSDVVFEDNTVTLGQPKAGISTQPQVENVTGTTFSAAITIDQRDTAAGYKALDMLMAVPDGLTVENVEIKRLDKESGSLSWELDEENKLRVAFLNTATNTDISIVNNNEGNTFPAAMFSIEFKVSKMLTAGDKLVLSIDGMSLKKSSDPDDLLIVDTTNTRTEIEVVEGITYTALRLYTGDNVDLISSTKQAVAVFVTGLDRSPTIPELTYDDGTGQYTFAYSAQLTEAAGRHAYVALVDAAIDMENFVKEEHFQLEEKTNIATISFGDTDGNETINAQDALNAVNFWLRKGNAPTDAQILATNINGDGRLNTHDALGIVEKFVGANDYHLIEKAVNSLAQAVTNSKTETNN